LFWAFAGLVSQTGRQCRCRARPPVRAGTAGRLALAEWTLGDLEVAPPWLGIVPDPRMAGRNYDDGHGKPEMPTVPEGWHYLPSSDGAGVLAPAAQFHPTFPHLDDRPNPILVLDAALGHAAEHFPATALWLLRECYWRT